jgi:MFS transporter, DHA1 family, multidrug resistance protein
VRTFLVGIGAIPRAAWTIIAGLFLVGVGNYMIVPFFALYLTKEIGLSVVQVGIALTVRLWAQRGCSLVGGVLADRFGTRNAMAAGLLLRSVAYGGIALASSFGSVLLWTAIIGVGAALYTPAGKAALARLSPPEARVTIFSLRNTAVNVGVAIGPPIGLVAAVYSYEVALAAASALFLALLVVTLLLVPRDTPAAAKACIDVKELRRLAAEPRVAWLAVVMALFFAFYVQMELTMPLFAEMHYSKTAAGLLFTVNAIAVVALQLPLSGWIARTALHTALSLGIAACGLGFFLLAAPLGLASFLLGVFVFTLGEIVIEPKVDGEIGRVVGARSLGASFGLLSVASSIGGAVGNYAGSLALEWGHARGHDEWAWVALGAAAFASAAGLYVSIQRVFVRRASDDTPKTECA